MSKLRKLWRLLPANHNLQQQLSDKLAIPGVIAQVLINRGVADEDTAREFLYGGADNLGNPYCLKDMEKAVKRIIQAIRKKEKITIYGDYDVDGITASALIYKVLKQLGADVEYYIPDRQSEGYGLNDAALESLWQNGTKLLLTVDCGISSITEVERVQGKLDVIITDHHQPPERLPSAYAIINPKQQDCSYPDKYLAGVGVAFKLCQALWQNCYGQDAKFLEYLDIVAIGTVADIVPLIGENRILVKLGLNELAATANIGLRALMTECGLITGNDKPIKVDTGKIGFLLAPRLNAAGRISQAVAGVELLITSDESRAQQIAKALDEENSYRQSVEKEILTLAEEFLLNIDLDKQKVLVLSGEDWHSGVIGIVASRLVDKYYRPVVIISIHDGVGKGSCRSIAGFDIYKALSQCSDLLTQFGGHHQAAGLSILPENIEKLRDRLNSIANNNLTDEDYIPKLNIDSLIPLGEINASFLEQLACLAPHGMGNPNPLFACRDLIIDDMRSIGQEGKHLKLRVRRETASGDVIAWQMGGLVESIQRNNSVDIAFFPEFNEWQGKRNIQLKAHDVRQTCDILDRTAVGQVYLILKDITKSQDEIALTNAQIAVRIKERFRVSINENNIGTALKILQELNLLVEQSEKSQRTIYLLPAPQEKLNIEQSFTFRQGLLQKGFIN